MVECMLYPGVVIGGCFSNMGMVDEYISNKWKWPFRWGLPVCTRTASDEVTSFREVELW